MFLTLSIFVALVFLGAILDALLSEKAKTDYRLRYLLAVLPSPYNFMKLYARVGDNLDDFTRAHAVSGMGYLGIMLIVAGFAWWADQQVLYGIEYVATRDHNYSWWQSVGIATIIQAILIFNGGMAIKLYINGSLGDKDHRIQFKIHTILGLIALASTATLSLQTGSIAEAKGIQAEANVKDDIDKEMIGKGERYELEISKLRAVYSTDSNRVASEYMEMEALAIAAFVADSTRKANDAARGANAKSYANARIDAYRGLKNRKIKEAAERKRAAFDSLGRVYGPSLASLQGLRTGLHSQTAEKVKAAEANIAGDVEKNAKTTRFKNILLNIVALFFNLGLQFFSRGANQNERQKRNAQRIQNGNGDKSNDGKDGLSGGQDIPIGRDDQPNTKTVGKKDPTKAQPFSGSGGSVEANIGLEEKTSDGQLLLLYRGTSKEEWWGWSQWRAALVNRVNKYQKAKSDNSRKTQLGWIRLIENKMTYIETNESGKQYPSRKPFDIKQPGKSLF